MPLLAFIIMCLLGPSTLSAPSIPLVPGHDYNLVSEVDYLFDPNHTLTINEVINSQNWKAIESSNINFSFIKDTLWLHFEVISQEDGDWILKIPFPLLDTIEIHSFKNGESLPVIITGDQHPFESRPIDHPHFLFPYSLQQHDDLKVYIKIRTSGASEVPIHFLPKDSSDLDYEITTFLQGWMNGILVVMIFYNMVIYVITKDHIYLSYSMTVLSYIFMFAAYNGSGFQYLWPNNPELNSTLFAFINAFYQITNCVFIIMFLKLFELNAWPKYIFRPLLYTLLILFPLIPFTPYHIIMLAYILLSVFLNISGLVVGAYCSLRGDRSAIYFTIAWFLLIFSIMIGNFRGLGYLPVNWFTLYSYQIGVFIEVIVLSIALAQRIEADRLTTILNLKKYEDLYNTTLSGQFTLDKDGVIKSVNPAFYKMLGYESENEVIELSQKGNGRFFHVNKSLPDQLFSMLDRIDKAFDLEVQLRTKSGKKKWFSVSIQIVKDNKGKTLAYEGSLIDIQERKENENINKKAIQERMIAMEHLVVGICHEINTPLGVSTTAISHLKEDLQLLNNSFLDGSLTKSDFTARLEYEEDAAELIENNLDRINNLVKSFKEISVLQKGYHYETESLCTVLENQITKFYSSIPVEKIHITCQKPLDFIGYPKAVEDIISQIISNCINHGFNEEQGDIFIEASSNSERITLEIKDNGQGIEIDNIRDIFNPFYTTKRGSKGSIGLGLYQVFNIVTQLLDGTVEVENCHPGTRFTISFPLHVREKVENDHQMNPQLGYT